MSEALTVSIALCTYNGSKYLGEQLASLERQTYKVHEIVIYDDGSREEERIKIAELASQYHKVRVFFGENVGVVRNFSRAVNECSGVYVALCDQDDVWSCDHISILMNAIGDYDLAYANVTDLAEDGSTLQRSMSRAFTTMGVDSRDENLFSVLLHGNPIHGSAAIVRRALVGTDWPETPRYHDWWLAILASLGNGIVYVNKSVTYHRLHEANASRHFDKVSGLERLLKFSSSKRRGIRRKNALDSLVCVSAVSTLALTADYAKRVSDYEEYLNNILKRKNRFKRTAYALTFKDELFYAVSWGRRLALSLSRLL